MYKTVFHTMHLIVRQFPDSIREELTTARNERQLWYGLDLVHDITVWSRGNGIFVVFFDRDPTNNLRERLPVLAENILKRDNFIEVEFFLETTIAEIKDKNPVAEHKRQQGIKCQKATAAVA
jgi:hypothetical protein